ncbi:MAG: DNA double-strand break repair protein Mre11, partial [Halothece sp.]
LRSDQLDQINNRALQKALSFAHSYSINPELVSQLARPRVPELGEQVTLDPITALKTYISNREDLQDLSEEMIDAANKLLNKESDQETESLKSKEQLNLL